jgi:hypothetical protein
MTSIGHAINGRSTSSPKGREAALNRKVSQSDSTAPQIFTINRGVEGEMVGVAKDFCNLPVILGEDRDLFETNDTDRATDKHIDQPNHLDGAAS